jgi:hypothetical protein
MLAAAVKRAREMGLLPYPDQDRKVRIGAGEAPAVAIAVDGLVETSVDGDSHAEIDTSELTFSAPSDQIELPEPVAVE